MGRFGVAFLATAAFGLASLQPAFAESAPAPSAETTNADTTPAPETPPPPPPPPPTETTESQPPPPDPAPTPKPADPPADPSPTPSADTADSEAPDAAEPAPTEAAEPDEAPEPAEQAPAETKPAPTPAPKDTVKLEPAPTPASAAAAPTSPPPAAAPPSGAPPNVVVVLVQDTPAAPDTAAGSEAAAAEAVLAATAIVSFRPRPTAGPISLDEAETAAKTPRKAREVLTARKPLARNQTCARPAARVPLSDKCKQVRAVASLQVTTLTYLRSPPEVRAAIAETAARVTVRRVEARPPPTTKAAKKRPVAEVRPIVPFGDSGQGVTNDGFNGSTGSSSSSRLFALAVVPLRVPWPFRFARLRLPSTLPHGVIPAPPSARPG